MSILRSTIFSLLLFFVAISSNAQLQYHFNQEVPVVQGSSASTMAWAGGLNAGQYNAIDLDNDGIQDLMIFDRDNNKPLTFLSDGAKYNYAPEFEHLFPEGLENWALLRDYN